MEQEKRQAPITKYFLEIEDPRWHNRRHKLLDILVIAICAVICGADSWEDIELFGKAKEEWLRVSGAAARDTFPRYLSPCVCGFGYGAV